MEKKNRSGVDFSKHELIIKKDELTTIHWLKIPDSMSYNIKFINVEGVLLVTGDFGRWSFYRNFIPHATDEKISDGYWCEKLKTCSTQEAYEFDEGTAIESIDEVLNDELEYRFGENYIDEVREFFEDLKGYTSNEIEFINYFRENMPDCVDWEDLPCHKKTNEQLQVVFDAFEEICNRLKTK